MAEQFAGLGIDDVMVRTAMLELGIEQKPLVNWNEQDMITLSDTLRRVSKPLVIAANKADIAPPQFIEKLKGLEAQGYKVVFCSAGYELALRMAAKNNLIDYLPGDKDFTIREPGKLNAQQKAALDKIKEFMQKYGGTGIQQAMNTVVFDLLNYIIAYPVEDETHFSDKSGSGIPGRVPY